MVKKIKLGVWCIVLDKVEEVRIVVFLVCWVFGVDVLLLGVLFFDVVGILDLLLIDIKYELLIGKLF